MGASAVLADRPLPDLGIPVVLSDNSLRALQQLAGAHRSRMSAWAVGITGTNGKTTTKELVALVLGTRHVVLKTEGNYNNHIGLPLTLLRLRQEHRVAVLEMGMSGLGEIALLCELAKPRVGVLTSIAAAHTLQLGSVENIARAKRELADALPPDGTLVANADDPLVLRIARTASCRSVTYGVREEADLVATDVRADGDRAMRFRVGDVDVRLPLWGRHNVYNALAALLVGRESGIALADGAAALGDASPVRGRMSIRTVGGVVVLDDSYNANPASVTAALVALRMVDAPGRRAVVLGEMCELGTLSEEAHRWVGRATADVAELMIGLGKGTEPALQEARNSGVDARFAESHEEAARLLGQLIQAGDAVLFKGSRAVGVERVLALWEEAHDE
jgi:UDP-N-acetylmuramoyl-tripeptide--D-alanyl-D-alanine ligase